MIVLVGESGSGKSAIAKTLAAIGCKNIVTYTTRPMREGEKDGDDYHFVSNDQFRLLESNGFFAETSKYANWNYGTPMKEIASNKVIVLTPKGLRSLKKKYCSNIVSFYINVPRRDRLIKILERGDDIEEAYRRSVSDIGQFDGVNEEVDYVIDNPGYKLSPYNIATYIFDIDKNRHMQGE